MQKYTLKQILFGLREAYIENEKKLADIKKYVKPKDDVKLSEFDFYEYTYKNDKYLELELKAQQSLIVQIIESIKNTKVDDDNKKKIEIANNMNGEHEYLVIPKKRIYQKIDLEELCKEAYALLESDFNNGMTSSIVKDDEDNLALKTTSSGIRIYTENTGKYPASGIIYNSKKDQILLTPNYQSIYLNEVAEILNTEVDATGLTKYQRDVIEKADINKPLLIKGLTSTIDTQLFDILENDETIELNRAKKKR